MAAGVYARDGCGHDVESVAFLDVSKYMTDGVRPSSENAKSMTEQPYHIDLESIRRAYPARFDAPQLLFDFADWIKGRPWGSVGCFRLAGEFSERAPIVDGSPLRNNFALFMGLPEGSSVGAWYPDIANPTVAPIVVLGSEGQHEILAGSLEGLLAKIALQRFEADGEWTDFTPHQDAEDATGQLADWLTKRLGVSDLEPLTKIPSALPNFTDWMGKWCIDREAFWATHPTMDQLSRELLAHRPTGKNPWDTTHFEVAIVGAQFQVRVLSHGRQPISESTAIEPILRKLRDDMWRESADFGLWYSMTFTLAADGRILPYFDYETRPQIGDVPADLAEAKSDFARAPRPPRWTPSWLEISHPIAGQ